MPERVEPTQSERQDRRVIVCNYAIARSGIAKGAKAYLSSPNYGGGFDRNRMLVRSRGGRLIEQWEATTNLKDWRVKTLPPEHPLHGDERIWTVSSHADYEMLGRLTELSGDPR